MTRALQNDAEYRQDAYEMIVGPDGDGIPAEVVPNEGTRDPANDSRTATGTPVSVMATPTVPVSATHLQGERVRATDGVTYVAAVQLTQRPEPGWIFRYVGEPDHEVVEAKAFRSGFEDAFYELIVRI